MRHKRGVRKTTVITTTYPYLLRPDEHFNFEYRNVAPKRVHPNRGKGDFLSFVGEDNDNLFGAFPRIPVGGTIESGQPFIFTNRNNMLPAPDLEKDKSSQHYISPWRV